MCNCSKLREIIADLDSSWINQATPFQGREMFTGFFEEIEVEELEPELNYSEFYYYCKGCGQAWYFECTPEETTSPLFGIKLQNTEHRLSQDEIDSQKEFITILAHNGFGSAKCRNAGCDNYKLNGKELCQKHLSMQ